MDDVAVMIREDGNLLLVLAEPLLELTLGAFAELEIGGEKSDTPGQQGRQLDHRAGPRCRHDQANDFVIPTYLRQSLLRHDGHCPETSSQAEHTAAIP